MFLYDIFILVYIVMEQELNIHCINLNSVNRDLRVNKNPLNFTVWLNDDHGSSSIKKRFTHIKFINFEYIVFPSCIQLLKQKMLDGNILKADIITLFSGLTQNLNEQYILNDKTYEICNKVINDNKTTYNFTINENKEISYEYINDNSIITINIYTPVLLSTPGNHIQYISIQPCDNKYIYSTKNGDFFKYVFPKLKTTSDLYTSSKKSFIQFKNNELLEMKRIYVQLLNNNCQPIIIHNLDNDYSAHGYKTLNEAVDYSSPSYYPRHPLNPKFQIDIFLKIGNYEQQLTFNNIFS